LRQMIEKLAEKDLARELPGRGNQTARYAIIHGLHDEACHSGEIWLLRKMIRSSAAELKSDTH